MTDITERAVLSVFLLMLYGASWAVNAKDSVCVSDLSVEAQPSFHGLKIKKISQIAVGSTEGGEAKIFLNSRGNPVYILVSQYGETGKNVILYHLQDAHSYIARVSNYFYLQPIYVGTPKVTKIETTTFLVCNDLAAGSVDGKIPEDMLKMTKEVLGATMEAYQAKKGAN